MKKILLVLTIALSFGQLSAQKSAWKKVAGENSSEQKLRSEPYSADQQLFRVNVAALKSVLVNATDRFSGNAGIVVEFPNTNGTFEKFQTWENSNFAPALQAQFPEIRAYVGKSLTDNSTIHFSISPRGLQTMLLRNDGSSEFIEPYTKESSVYVLFDSKTRTSGKMPFVCSTVDQSMGQDIIDSGDFSNRSNDQSYKTMRLALSCVGEYATYFGGTVEGALGGMNATMTRVNGVLETDVALHLNLIENNALVVYTNASSDPYSGAASGSGGAWNSELENNLEAVLGTDAYDIGHLLGASGGGGNAGCIGCVCTGSSKGSGFTSPYDGIPEGDNFDIDYVVHEMGHQLGANHTFSHNTEGSGVNVEPGSGSTIMGYAGITNYNVQEHSDAYFTYRSIQQIQNNLAGKTCPVSVVLTNTPPVIEPLVDFTVPSGTAYILKGNVTDPDGDSLTYTWEQNNSAPASQSGANSVASPTKVLGPVYRSFAPSASPDRYLPEYSKVLAGTLSTTWESVSNVARSLKFTLTARDNNPNGPQTNNDEVLVTSPAPFGTNAPNGVGPFRFSSMNTTGITWAFGETKTITWDVNNTTTLPGSDNVNIRLSIDGGVTFPYTLASNAVNDGSEDIIVPNVPASTNCRLWIEPVGNVYYAVNSTAFAVGYEMLTTTNTYTYSDPFDLPNSSTSYTVKTINVPVAGTISDVNISVNATHSNLQNLTFAVIRPGGSLFTYYAQQCEGSSNMDVTFDSDASAFECGGTLKGSNSSLLGSPLVGTMALPSGSLDILDGFNQLGNWQFGFKDSVSGADSGTINSVSLTITTQSLVLANKEFGFQDFAMFPNPNNGNFTVQFNAASEDVTIDVYDISGRAIFNKSYANAGLFSQEVQLSNAQSGIYLVSVKNGDQKVVKRIVVE